jgi:hypothetical protein
MKNKLTNATLAVTNKAWIARAGVLARAQVRASSILVARRIGAAVDSFAFYTVATVSSIADTEMLGRPSWDTASRGVARRRQLPAVVDGSALLLR